MPYYEIITEQGTSMVACYDDDEQMLSAVSAHHEKAKKGELGGPSGHVAERIVRVEKYENHPADAPAAMSADVAKSEMAALIDEHTKDGVVDVEALAFAARSMNSPLVSEREDRHASIYTAEADEVFAEGWDKDAA